MSPRYDAVVVGSGPGGSAVARDLARAGWRVALLERGRDWRRSVLHGTYPGALLYADRRALLFTREGLNIIRPLMLGGATSMYAGCSAPPPAWLRARYGIDLEPWISATVQELGIRPLPPELRGAASTAVAEAAQRLGMHWVPQDKFMLPERGAAFACGAHCLLGCRCGAKWNAAEWADQAVAAGAELRTRTRARRVLVDGTAVRGVETDGRGDASDVLEAPCVILAAGGLGTVELLRSAGIDEAGIGMAMDTTTMVYGRAPGRGMGGDPPMTWSCEDPALDVMYSTLLDPWLMYPIITALKGARYPLTWHRWGRTRGVMIKLRDELSGQVERDGSISKGLTENDRVRLSRAEAVARDILLEAGCEPGGIFTTPLRGTHPSATARIGHIVDSDLGTGIAGLHVCDASVFPEALGRPTVLTIIGFARRLAARLTKRSPA
jgi:choline dehydrogenase-like flavoprotein